jgi:hypothetical protein
MRVGFTPVVRDDDVRSSKVPAPRAATLTLDADTRKEAGE